MPFSYVSLVVYSLFRNKVYILSFHLITIPSGLHVTVTQKISVGFGLARFPRVPYPVPQLLGHRTAFMRPASGCEFWVLWFLTLITMTS